MQNAELGMQGFGNYPAHIVAADCRALVSRKLNGKVAHLTSVHAASDIRILCKECRSLSQAGLQVSFVVPSKKAANDELVNIRALPKASSRLTRMTKGVWNVYQEAVRLDADVYHFHDPELIPVGLLLRARNRIVVYDIHEDVPKDILSKHYLPKWSRRIIAWAAQRVENAACQRFSALVAATPSIHGRFKKLNPCTTLVRNFPIPEEIASGPEVPWERKRLAVAYIGGITALRGIREMIHAIALLPDSFGATLEIAGSAIYGDDLKDLPTLPGWRRTRDHGYLDRNGIADLLAHVRAGLVLFHPAPNHNEAMPMKLFEYMAAGIPIIASNFPAWREIIEPAGCGLLVDPLCPQEIAEAIQYVLTNHRAAEEMGRRGKAAVAELYNWQSQSDLLLELYQHLLNNRHA